MPCVLGRVQPGPLCQFLYDARHVDTGQPVRLYLPVAIDRAEQRPAVYSGLFDPIPQRANRACLGIRTIKGFRPAQRHGKTILAECAIVRV
jgi:hypothetical protein